MVPPHFNAVAATKSIGQSNILNIERGRGESIGCNAISLKMRGKTQIIANFYESLNHFARDCRFNLQMYLYVWGLLASFLIQVYSSVLATVALIAPAEK